jgi:hypothetical protein
MVGETAVVPYQLWRLDQEHIPETAVTLEMTLGEALSLPSQSLSLLIINS